MATASQADKVLPSPSRFRQPLSVFYIPPMLRHDRLRRGRVDWGGPLVLEVPLFVMRLLSAALKSMAYVGIVAGRAVALPFRSADRQRDR